MGADHDSGSAYFFLWRFLRNRFFRLCVAIFLRLRLRPFGMFSSALSSPHDQGLVTGDAITATPVVISPAFIPPRVLFRHKVGPR